MRLADDPDLLKRLGQGATARVRQACHGPSRAYDLVSAWEKAR